VSGPGDYDAHGWPGILELRFKLRPVKLVTHSDLVLHESNGATVFPALRIEEKIEEKSRGVEIRLVARTFNRHVVFRGVVPDEHGVTVAAVRVLFRAFEWKKTDRVFLWEDTDVWRPTWRRSHAEDNFDLWIIAHWMDWNVAGIMWERRNRFAQDGEMSLGKMELDTFMRRCRRLKLQYLVK
jgi:hypothetical protein